MLDCSAVSDIADRYRRVADTFTARADAVPDDGWEEPAPCEGWTVRDVVRHLVETATGGWPTPSPPEPTLCPTTGGRSPHRAKAGRSATLSATWSSGSRLSSPPPDLDADVVHDMLVGMEPFDDLLRSSGHYGPRVEVPADADEQTRLIAFTGRRP